VNKYQSGLFYGLFAYIIWGALPIYWGWMRAASAWEIISHRAIWSLVVCWIALAYRHQLKSALQILKKPRMFFLLALTAGLVSGNWAIYIWSVTVDRIVESSLGYYITPLMNVAFGVIILRERMRVLQWIAVAIATIGVAALTYDYGQLPLIALGLACTWGIYSVIKKKLDVDPLTGLAIETIFAAIPALIFLVNLEFEGRAQFGSGLWISIGLATAGLATVLPLLAFNNAAVRLPLTTLGLMQYITPTVMFLVGVFINHEEMSGSRWIGFLTIWLALSFLATDMVRSGRSGDKGITQG
jgi:chloramphenicol-sensitive protein RarD